jgi:hypothetical protein
VGSHRWRTLPFALPALAATVAAGLALAASAQAGLSGAAKRETKAAISERGLQPVKLGCRQIGKRGSDGARCHWVAAERRGGKSFSCRGTSELRSARATLRFKRSGCRKDGGATGLNRTMPDRLAKKGLETTDAFCWGLLGRGFKCSFEARRFADRTYDCSGLASFYKKRFQIRRKSCTVNAAATAAQAGLASTLAGSGLSRPEIRCREGGAGWECDWRAYRSSAGWTYHCDGAASAASPEGGFHVDPCRLRAPDRSPRGSANPALHFGVNEAWGQELGEVDRAGRLGGDTLRANLTWASVEHTQGQYNWGAFDALYSRILASGARPLFIVTGAPCWATQRPGCTKSGHYPPAPAFDQAWGDFVAAAAARYPQARGIEVWNEPNFAAFYAGGPDPERYAKLLRIASAAVKSVAPQMPVISGGLAAFTKNGKGAMRYDKFLRRMLAAGAATSADAIGHHAYSGRLLRDGHVDGLRLQLAELKDVMVDFGAEQLPFWITETGVSTADKKIDQREQAKTDVRAYKMLRKTPGVETVIVHRWRDQPGKGAESGYGLTTRKGKAKKALCALAKARGRSCPK